MGAPVPKPVVAYKAMIATVGVGRREKTRYQAFICSKTGNPNVKYLVASQVSLPPRKLFNIIKIGFRVNSITNYSYDTGCRLARD
jgi:hypothetical protein